MHPRRETPRTGDRTPFWAGLVTALLVLVCCAGPLLWSAGVLAVLGAWLAAPAVIAVLATLALGGALATWAALRRRRRRHHDISGAGAVGTTIPASPFPNLGGRPARGRARGPGHRDCPR